MGRGLFGGRGLFFAILRVRFDPDSERQMITKVDFVGMALLIVAVGAIAVTFAVINRRDA